MTIVTMHEVIEAKMAEVMEVAKAIGSVTINVYDSGDMIYALEGVHRTEAAKRLELPLILNRLEWDEVVYTDCEDVDGRDENGMATVAAIFAYAYESGVDGQIYSASDFESVE